MIFITGDTHGDLTRFNRFRSIIKRRRNYCIVCGDFGFIWDGSEKEKKALSQLRKLDCTILFVEGTHDNLDLISAFPSVDFMGGHALRVAENIYKLQRGEIYTIDGRKIFAFGGRETPDADERIEGVNWWPGELPSADEIYHARNNLTAVQNSVDIIVTHQPPSFELGLIENVNGHIDVLTSFLDELSRTVAFKHWYFGALHIDRDISSRMSAVFERVIPLK